MEIKELSKAVFEQAQQRGLYKYITSPTQLLWHIREEAQEAIRAYKSYGDLKVHYECKSHLSADCIKPNFNCAICHKRSNEGVSQELADVIIMTLSACEYLGIDIEDAITRKMEYNAIRER